MLPPFVLFVAQRLIATLSVALVTLSTSIIGMPVFHRSAVISCTTSTPAAYRPVLRRGDSGSCVLLLQKNLSLQGWSVNVDGSFTEQTELAVRRFQSSWQWLPIDGVVRGATWSRLVNGGSDPYSVTRGPNPTGKVVLSFDDCPKSLTSFKTTLLSAESQGIRLVLFPYGQCREWGLVDPAFAMAHGHYLFNHSYSHPDLTTLTRSQVMTELAKGPAAAYGRPPYGAYNQTVKDAYALSSMRIWTWTVDTEDWKGKPQADVVAYVIANARSGGTVLMHMQYNAFNGDALAQIKAGLAARGQAICRNHGAVDAYPVTIDC